MEVEMEVEASVKLQSSNASVKSGASRKVRLPINVRKIPVPINRLDQSDIEFVKYPKFLIPF